MVNQSWGDIEMMMGNLKNSEISLHNFTRQQQQQQHTEKEDGEEAKT